MSYVPRNRDKESEKKFTPEQRKKLLQEPRWNYCKDQVDHDVLEENFNFLNKGVVMRGDASGTPLMTTSGIYGPIKPNDMVSLHQDRMRTVTVLSDTPKDSSESLLQQLKELKIKAGAPHPDHCMQLSAKWVSGKDGGAILKMGGNANVFGDTGSLYVKNAEVQFPILDHYHPEYHTVMAYYGAKLLKPGEPFYMGFDKKLFGMEYDTSNPGYIQDYVMKEYGGAGLFVEHHPFPHIWFPNPGDGERSTNVCRILLGRVVPGKGQEWEEDLDYFLDGGACTLVSGDAKDPQIRFTIFEIPTDGSAIAVDECCIHNDSFCNGKQVVFLADTHANTVALRETAPYTNIHVNQVSPPID